MTEIHLKMLLCSLPICLVVLLVTQAWYCVDKKRKKK